MLLAMKGPRYYLLILVCFLNMHFAYSQDVTLKNTFSLNGTFQPNSDAIWIGESEQRRIWTAGFEYSRLLWSNRLVALRYQGSASPFVQESDPTLVGVYTKDASLTYPRPERIISVVRGPIAYSQYGNVAIYPIYGYEKTYAAIVTPLGARVNLLKRHKIQPTASTDAGMMYSSRAIPIDTGTNFNYLFSFGPGVEVFSTPRRSVRLEYLFRHISNANSGKENPGIDGGVWRLTLSLHK